MNRCGVARVLPLWDGKQAMRKVLLTEGRSQTARGRQGRQEVT